MKCPHLRNASSAFCICGISPEFNQCPVYSELCAGNGWPCYADLGPWGAWRAGLAETMEAVRHDDM